MSKRTEYEEYLNELYDMETVLDETEHCWAGNDKSEVDKATARSLAEQGMYGTVLKKFDPIAFNVGFNDWSR
jgi:hypothetical protein